MSPDELRAAAERHYHCQSSERDADVLIDAARRLADVIEQCEKALSDERYYRQRNAFLWIAGIARGETNKREKP